MMSKIFILTFAMAFALIAAQLHYQQADTNANRKPTGHSRQPFVSDKCTEGELLYPGDNEKDWVCDCKPLYVYHPATAQCYEIYEKGPCRTGEILTLAIKKSVPECTRSNCASKGKGVVWFNGKCVKVDHNEQNSCRRDFVVQVNPTTLQLTCGLNLDNRNSFDDEVPSLNYTSFPIDENGSVCLIAGKRSQESKCLD